MRRRPVLKNWAIKIALVMYFISCDSVEHPAALIYDMETLLKPKLVATIRYLIKSLVYFAQNIESLKSWQIGAVCPPYSY